MYNNRGPKTLPKFVSQSVIREMLDKAKTESRKFSYRNYIILMTFARTGMRIEEVATLKKKDILNDTIIVRRGKGDKDRVIPLDSELGSLLGLYTDRLGPKDYVFPIKIRQIRNIVYKYAIADLDIHPHTYRHSFAVHCLLQGMNVRNLQKIMGHTNLETTAVYLDLTSDDTKKDFEKVDW